MYAEYLTAVVGPSKFLSGDRVKYLPTYARVVCVRHPLGKWSDYLQNVAESVITNSDAQETYPAVD